MPRWGELPWPRGVVLVGSGAAAGALITTLTGSEPGLVLGLLIVVGTIAAALAVQPRAAYRIIPAPAIAYTAAAVLAGLIHDRSADTSRTALAISAAQWIAGGFLAMIAATILAIVITSVRRQLSGPARQGRGYRAPARSGAAGRRGRGN
jgi:Ni,Fe-hydrogenase III small subunit